jgi:hypothetical protein
MQINWRLRKKNAIHIQQVTKIGREHFCRNAKHRHVKSPYLLRFKKNCTKAHKIWSHWTNTGLPQKIKSQRRNVFLCKPPKSISKWFISVSCQPHFWGPEVRDHEKYQGPNLPPSLFSLSAITEANVPVHTTQLKASQAIKPFNFQRHSPHETNYCLPTGSALHQLATPWQATRHSWKRTFRPRLFISQISWHRTIVLELSLLLPFVNADVSCCNN